jgi:chromosome segregation ATPase
MRVYLEPDDQMLEEINQAAKITGIGKAKFILEAVDHYLHGDGQSEIAKVQAELDRAKADLDQRWVEITTLRATITELKSDLEKSRSLVDQLQIDNEALKRDADQARHDLDTLQHDHDTLLHDQVHYKDTINQRDQLITFLQGHISQLTSKMPALPGPIEERAERRHWWKFW